MMQVTIPAYHTAFFFDIPNSCIARETTAICPKLEVKTAIKSAVKKHIPRIYPPSIVANRFGSAIKHSPLLPDPITSYAASEPRVANKEQHIAVDAMSATAVSDSPCVTVVSVISDFACV